MNKEFEKWMKEFYEENEWDEGWTRDNMRDAFEAGKFSIPIEPPVILRATEVKLYRPYYCCEYGDEYMGEDILFTSEDKAWEYIRSRCCGNCQSIDGGRGSQCEAEWDVMVYDSCESK